MKMGKYHITGLVAVFCGLFAWSQDFSGKRVINPEPSTVRMVRSADVDGDGDMDVAVVASSFISWYENLDGQGSFGPPVAVQYVIDGAASAYLMVVDTQTGSSDNYILDVATTQVQLDISGLTTGTYDIILVCDGELQNHKTLLKQ